MAKKPQEFVSEEELPSFEEWIQIQTFDRLRSTQEELATLSRLYDQMVGQALATPKFGRMNLRPKAGEYRYAVVAKEAGELWILLWVRRSPRGDVYVLTPRGEEGWNPHVSYHADGRFHASSYDHRFPGAMRQPPGAGFQGHEHLGVQYGCAARLIGANCDPAAFNGILEVAPELFTRALDAGITVDLAAPGVDPPRYTWDREIARKRFCDFVPNVVIAVGHGQHPERRGAADAKLDQTNRTADRTTS